MSQQQLGFHYGNLRSASKYNRRFGIINGLLAATLITGANWYFQSKVANAKIQKQDQLIRRVSSGQETAYQKLLLVSNQNDADQLQGKKVQVTGSIQPGRFIIKRNKGDQQGYVVLAPYIVERHYGSLASRGRAQNTKFMINLGWIPKENKNRMRETSAVDVLPINDQPDHLADDEDWRIPITSTINAYVRTGQQADEATGLTNEPQKHVYRLIDLNLFANLFGNVNKSSRYVYLDRCATPDEQESFPFPKSEESFKEELQHKKSEIKKAQSLWTTGVGFAAYIGAYLAF